MSGSVIAACCIGANVTGGMSGFFFDPFEFYAQRHLTNPNMIVMGSVGLREVGDGQGIDPPSQGRVRADRYLAIIDPKGEYGPVADDLGLTVVKPHPGGRDRINPMERRRGRRRRQRGRSSEPRQATGRPACSVVS